MVYQQAVLDVAFEGKLTKTTKKIGWKQVHYSFAKEIRTGPLEHYYMLLTISLMVYLS